MPKVTPMDILKIAAANPDATVPPEGLELLQGKQAKRNKYNAVRVDFEGMKFDSKGEMARWGMLRQLELAGEISDLERQVVFVLPGDVKLKADFRYKENGKLVVEDYKGGKATQTPAFRNKWKQAKSIFTDIEWRIVEG